jgi:acyl-CoA synthetase (AMP-forming)/AMP-acid ligase II
VSRRLLAAFAAVATAGAIAVPVAPGATQVRSFVLYARLAQMQFVNHADDRERGDIQNPFTQDTLATPPSANSGKKGTRAGDNALYSLKLFSDVKLRKPVGTAIYSCTFNFAQEAICSANFQLSNGSMLALGPAKLDGSTFVIPVTGGTGHYAGAHGQLTSKTNAVTSTQVIRFQLV